MACAEANKVDLVDYLCSLGYTSTKIKANDYWYLLPLRDETTASFKIDRSKNLWYDHGTGNGGTVIHFTMRYFNRDAQAALPRLEVHVANSETRLLMNYSKENNKTININNVDRSNENLFSFHQQKDHQPDAINDDADTPFHLHENSLINNGHAAETAIQIIAAKQPIAGAALRRYLKERCLNKNIADKYCHEASFELNKKNGDNTVIGFKNNAGGYGLMSELFKLGSTPKYVTYIDNHKTANDLNSGIKKTEFLLPEIGSDQPETVDQDFTSNAKTPKQIFTQSAAVKRAKSIAVFEGLFDLLSWLTIHHKQQTQLTNFLLLNSLSFFERSLLLMEKHEQVNLYPDHDTAGRKCVAQALKRSVKYEDKSNLYKGYKDLNDWLMNFGKLEKKYALKHLKGWDYHNFLNEASYVLGIPKRWLPSCRAYGI